MPPALPVFLILTTLLPAAQAADAVYAQTFASEEQTGQPMGLTVDDAGRVFLACTGRAFGRGVDSVAGNDKLRREDAAVLSLDDRRAAQQRWVKEGAWKAAPGEAGESVVGLIDTDHDGRADQRVIAAGDFRDALDGPAGGILKLEDGGFLFACTPSLWRLEDDNGDARADRRLPVLSGFGVRTGNGLPGLRALTEGPDGRIYFTSGDRGSRVVSAEGERFVLEGTGGVWRCRADGTELELLATGLTDPAGILVDLSGRVFVADTAPDAETTRLLRVLPGADLSHPPPGLLIATLPGRVTGLIHAPSLEQTAPLSACLMADGRRAGAVVPLTLQEKDGTFTATAGTAVWQGGAVCGLAAAPDGSVIWSEWPRGFTAAGTARIMRLAPPANVPGWNAAALLLAKGITRLDAAELPPLLEHAHPLVRLRARQCLTRLGYQESLDLFTRTAKRSPSLPARLNAVWGLAALARSTPMLLNEVQLLLTSAEPDIRALAVHIIGESGGVPAREILPLLRDASPGVQVEAAIALGRLRPPGMAEEIASFIHQCGDTQPALRHALTFALTRLSTPSELAARGAVTDSPHVKSAVLAALRQLRAAEITGFLDDGNPEIVTAAAMAIYDRRILPGYPLLAAALEKCAAQPVLVQPDFIRRALAAALYTGTAEAAAAVASLAALPADKLPADLRTAALDTLAAWDTPPPQEPVHHRHDPPLSRPPGLARAHLDRLRPESARPRSPAALIAAWNDAQLDDARRGDALQQLAAIQPAKAMELARELLSGKGTAAQRAVARTVVMTHDSATSYAQLKEVLATGWAREVQTALTLAQRFDSKQSDVFWTDLGKQFIEGHVAAAWRLEVWEGLQQRDVASRGAYRRILESADAALDEAADPLARWRLCETGGDPGTGRRIFETSLALNCTACHSLHGRGGTSAPELDRVAARLKRDELLASLVQPSRAVAPGYGEVTATLLDGSTVSGTLRRRDDAALLLVTPQGHRRLKADDVRSLSAAVSPMPSAATLLTPREIRDLMAWLETLK